MKQMKFFLVALMCVVIGVSVTSCLDSDDGPHSAREYVKVNRWDMPVTFTNIYGQKLIPLASVNFADKDWALITYEYDPKTASATTMEVTLLDNPTYIDPIVGYTTSSEEEGNAPFFTLAPYVGGTTYSAMYFDKNTFLMPIAYKFLNTQKEEEASEEAKKHSFRLVYNPEAEAKEGELVLNFYHYIAEEPDGEKVERTSNMLENKIVDFSSPLATYHQKSGGKNPTTIKVVVMENQENNDLSKATKKEYSYPYPFKE